MLVNNNYCWYLAFISVYYFQSFLLVTVCSTPLQDEVQQIATRALVREQNGYFEYLPIAGLWGRFLHYLITDDKTFGQLIVKLNEHMKNYFGEQNLLEMEDSIVLNFPIFIAGNKLLKTIGYVWDVKSKSTGKTFGEAIETLYNVSLHQNLVDEFVRRMEMPSRIDDLRKAGDANKLADPPRIGYRRALNMADEVLRVHPEVFVNVLRDQNAMQLIARKLVSSMKKRLNFQKILAGMQALANAVYKAQPDRLDNVINVLLSLQDPETGVNVYDVVQVLRNILNSEENIRAIAEMFREQEQLGFLELDVNPQKIQTALTRVSGTLYHPKYPLDNTAVQSPPTDEIYPEAFVDTNFSYK